MFDFIKRISLIAIIAVLITTNIDLFSFANTTLRFVQLSDVHISDRIVDIPYKALTSSKSLLKDAITQINTLPYIDFVMVTGDAVDSPKQALMEEYIDEMNKLKSPWLMGFGNHDLPLGGTGDKGLFLKLLQENNNNFKFDNSYYSFVPKKGFKCFVLNSVITDKLTSRGCISEEQLKWLKKRIDETNSEDFILIFLHHPVLEPYSSPNHILKNAQDLENIAINAKRPIAIFSGHYHAAKITKKEQVLHASAPALVTYPNAFRVINVVNLPDKVVINLSFKETKLTDVQKKSKALLISPSTFVGEEKDRNITYTLEK